MFSPAEQVHCYGKVTDLAAVWTMADEKKLPYVYMLDGCSLGDGVAWPVSKDALVKELKGDFEDAHRSGMGPFVAVFEKIDDRWSQCDLGDMKQKLGL